MSRRLFPPGPKSWWLGYPIVRRLRRDVLGFYDWIQREYGDVVYMRLGPFHDYTLFHPDHIQEVLVEKSKQFIRFERPIQVLSQWNGHGVIISEGETWARHRRILQPAFHPRRMNGYVQLMASAVTEALDKLEAKPAPFDFDRWSTTLTTDVICRAMFGARLGTETDRLQEATDCLSPYAVREMMKLVSIPLWAPLPEQIAVRKAIRVIDDLAWRFLRERRASGRDEGDLLSMLLLAVDNVESGKGLTDQEARDQCVTILLVGHDTSAAGLSWIGWNLATHPEIARRAAEEVDRVLGDRMATVADIERLDLVSRIVKESLRLYPPAVTVLTRKATCDVEIGGWSLPKGALVHALFLQTHRDPRWFPDPLKFDPDRFLPENEARIPKGAFLPFGAGPRACIGQAFAMLELTLTTALLLRRFEISKADGQGKPELNLLLSLRPKGGLRLRLTPRKRAAVEATVN